MVIHGSRVDLFSHLFNNCYLKPLKRWLGLQRTPFTACFYSCISYLQFPNSELTEEGKSGYSGGIKIKSIKVAKLAVNEGQNANTPKAVEDAKANFRMKDITDIGD